MAVKSAITGLVVDSDNVPHFEHDSDEAFVNDNWSNNRWNDNSVVRFRDCSIKISTILPACDRPEACTPQQMRQSAVRGPQYHRYVSE